MDSSIATDPRFKLLGRALGVNWKEAIGSCYLLWLACYDRRSKCFAKVEADIAAELEGFADALLKVGLATRGDTADEIIVHGVEPRIVFLEKQVEKASKGGKKSGETRRSSPKRRLEASASRLASGPREANASGDPEANGEAYSPALAPDLDQAPDPEREKNPPPGWSSLSKSRKRALEKHLATAQRLWELQGLLRKEALPGTHSLEPTAERLAAVAERLEAGASPADCETVLREYAAEAKRDKGGGQWFNGSSNWRAENFNRALGQAGTARGTNGEGASQREYQEWK